MSNWGFFFAGLLVGILLFLVWTSYRGLYGTGSVVACDKDGNPDGCFDIAATVLDLVEKNIKYHEATNVADKKEAVGELVDAVSDAIDEIVQISPKQLVAGPNGPNMCAQRKSSALGGLSAEQSQQLLEISDRVPKLARWVVAVERELALQC